MERRVGREKGGVGSKKSFFFVTHKEKYDPTIDSIKISGLNYPLLPSKTVSLKKKREG